MSATKSPGAIPLMSSLGRLAALARAKFGKFTLGVFGKPLPSGGGVDVVR